jgi:serine/threonine protein kinase
MITISHEKSKDGDTISKVKSEDKNKSSKMKVYSSMFNDEITKKIIYTIMNSSEEVIEETVDCIRICLGYILNITLTNENNDEGGNDIKNITGDFKTFVCVILSDQQWKGISLKKGDVLVCQTDSETENEVPSLCLKYHQVETLLHVYLSVKDRVEYSKKVKEAVRDVKRKPMWEQCPQKYLNMGCLLGKGSYGNVYTSRYDNLFFAVKISRIKNKIERTCSSWNELFFLKKIRELIRLKKCPNLPLLHDYLICEKCSLNIESKDIETPCITTLLEIADGTLKEYLEVRASRGAEHLSIINHRRLERADGDTEGNGNKGDKENSKKKSKHAPPSYPIYPIEELNSVLFQIMAGLWCVQKYLQIMNFDVKKENILFYNVKPGGYWKYNILGQDYYVPNYGKLFVLNDFGISRMMHIDYPMFKNDSFRLGSRYGKIQKKNGIERFVPICIPGTRKAEAKAEAGDKSKDKNENHKITWLLNDKKKRTLGAEFKISKDGVISPSECKIEGETIKTDKEFFLNPEVIPPFEFYNDTQDVIRIFTTGKKTTQKGEHRKTGNIPEEMINVLKSYVGKGENTKSRIFTPDPSMVVAGYFIKSYFGMYREKIEGDIIDEYVI